MRCVLQGYFAESQNKIQEVSKLKKSGILNAKLMEAITSLGHLDAFVICDMGFPIPCGAEKIDLALVRGVPGFLLTFREILKEVVVEQAILMDKIGDANPDTHRTICALLKNQSIVYKSFSDFREACKDAKFFVRTGEDLPCSNILLVSASGVTERVERYDVQP